MHAHVLYRQTSNWNSRPANFTRKENSEVPWILILTCIYKASEKMSVVQREVAMVNDQVHAWVFLGALSTWLTSIFCLRCDCGVRKITSYNSTQLQSFHVQLAVNIRHACFVGEWCVCFNSCASVFDYFCIFLFHTFPFPVFWGVSLCKMCANEF